MPTYYAFDTLHTLTTATTAIFKCYKFTTIVFSLFEMLKPPNYYELDGN